jgi:ABC-type multidrug transport system ATPase subunit
MSQDNYLFEHLTCYQNLEIIFSSPENTSSMNLCNDFLSKFNIIQLKDKYPHEISIGQRQILCFIRCLLVDSEYFILDEPTSALDEENRNMMTDILKKLKSK